MAKKETDDIRAYLTRLLTESNNLMLISVAYNIILLDIAQFRELFANIADNYFLRGMSIQYRLHWNKNLLTAPHDHYANISLLEYTNLLKLPDNYNDMFADAFFQVQRYPETQERIQSLLDEMHKSNNKEVKNFAHNTDLRNFVPIGESDGKVFFSPKEVEDIDLIAYRKTLHQEADMQLRTHQAKFFLKHGGKEPPQDEILQFIHDYQHQKQGELHPQYEDLGIYCDLFCIQNKYLFSEEEFNDSLQRMMHIISSVDFHKHGTYWNLRAFETLSSLKSSFIAQYSQEIISFIYRTIIRARESRGFTRDQTLLLVKLMQDNSTIKQAVFSLLLSYCYFDEELLSLYLQVGKKKNRKTITIPLKAISKDSDEEHFNLHAQYHEKKAVFSEKMLEEYWKNDKQVRTAEKINFENLYVLDRLVAIGTYENVSELETHIITILKEVIEDNTWFERNGFVIQSTIANFLCKSIQNNWNINNLQNYVLEHYEILYEIIIHTINDLSAAVQDNILESSVAWKFYKQVFEKLSIYPYRDKFTLNFSTEKRVWYHLGQLLTSLFLRGSNWVESFKKQDANINIKIIDDNKEKFIEWASVFLDSPAGITNFTYIFIFYHNQLGTTLALKYLNSLATALTNAYAYEEELSTEYYELFCNSLYMNFQQLSEDEKKTFHELVTVIGCNAPSAFTLYLKNKIES